MAFSSTQRMLTYPVGAIDKFYFLNSRLTRLLPNVCQHEAPNWIDILVRLFTTASPKSPNKMHPSTKFYREEDLLYKPPNSYPGTEAELQKLYDEAVAKFQAKDLPKPVQYGQVFACNSIDLQKIKVYGFDYDYTLAIYRPHIFNLLYTSCAEILVKQFKYPEGILDYNYDPNFAIRGLHYDIDKGLLLKMDAFLQIQLGTVFRGRTRLSDEEVFKIYGTLKLPIDYVEGKMRYHGQKAQKMMLLCDLFSLPNCCLLCDITEHFSRNGIKYHPALLFYDIQHALFGAHANMHQQVAGNENYFLEKDPKLVKFFESLVRNDKKLFMLTNSPYWFVNSGMRYLVGTDWRDFFDVIVVESKKPHFFTDNTRPFRIYDHATHGPIWDHIDHLDPHRIYASGSVDELLRLTGWKNDSILYFGDQLFSDLAEGTLKHGWRTGAILNELYNEISVRNHPEYITKRNWNQRLTRLIEKQSDNQTPAGKIMLKKWIDEARSTRIALHEFHNKRFGSVFRTKSNPSYFSRRLFRLSDIYTSKLINLSNYAGTHHFYPRRSLMPHEYRYFFM